MVEARSTDNTGNEDFDYPDGGAVYLRWSDVGEWDGPGNQAIGGYHVHWGDRAGPPYANHIDIDDPSIHELYIPDVINEESSLLNGERYYFSVTAYTLDQAESSYYDEMVVIPQDTVAPIDVVTLSGSTVAEEEGKVILSWSEIEGAYAYQVSYGFEGNADSMPFDVSNNTDVEIGPPLTLGTTYSFVVRVVDEAGNVGNDSNIVNILID